MTINSILRTARHFADPAVSSFINMSKISIVKNL